MLGALLKMKMRGFRDNEFREPTRFFYIAQVNPDSYNLDYSVQLNPEQSQGTSGTTAAYVGSKPRKLSFEVIFDGTGALGDLPTTLAGVARLPSVLANAVGAVGITAQISLFKRTVYDYFGESHRTPFVQLQWGTLLFQCQIESMTLAYKLFDPQGVPLRASAKVVFQEVLADTWLTRLANPLSADLTHIRTVQAGDTLPLLCQQVYGDATLYPKVALANKLVNFRRLRVGQQVAFPPLVPAEAAADA